jgi:hypothetical protein
MNKAIIDNGQIRSLTLEQAAAKAPAIMATKPADYINLKRYNFVPTTDIIEKMSNQGWQLTEAKQSKTNVDLRRDYGVHIVQFQHPDFFIKDGDGNIEGRPTVMFVNSHDGSRPIASDLGIFRLVCSNGLVIKSQDFGGFKERHTKLTNEGVKQLLDEHIGKMSSAVQNINRWNGIEMKALDMRKFATDALLLRLGDDRQVEDHEVFSVLNARRDADRTNTLWHVYNRVQENIIKGGFDIGNRQARGISNPLQDLKLNQGLWQLAEQYAS